MNNKYVAIAYIPENGWVLSIMSRLLNSSNPRLRQAFDRWSDTPLKELGFAITTRMHMVGLCTRRLNTKVSELRRQATAELLQPEGSLSEGAALRLQDREIIYELMLDMDSLIFELRSPDESCEAYTPVCSDFSCDSAGTVACIAYPASTMKGSNFQAAAFSVNELKELKSEAKCENLKEPPPQVGKPHSEILKGVKFVVTETDGVAAGNLINGYAYRSFRKNECYELDIRIAFSNLANYDPGTMKNFRLKAVHGQLKKVLDTFEFTK